jgi:hypothetical protein
MLDELNELTEVAGLPKAEKEAARMLKEKDTAGLEEKTRITLGFLKRKEAEFEAIKSEIDVLKSDLESTRPTGQGDY